MSMRKKLLALLISAAMLLSAFTVYAANPVKVFYSGSEVFYDVAPQVIANHTMVPIRSTIETITGEEMGWDAATKTVTFYANGHTNKHTIGQTVVYVDGIPVYFDTPSLMIDNRMLVPIRMIAETSGCKVDWDPANRYVIITPPVSPPTEIKPGIINVSASKTTINAGESAVLSVRTNSVVNNVWVDDGHDNANAAYQSTEASSGVKTWTATVRPNTSRNVTVYANTAQTTTGAATKTQYITVVGSSVSIVNFSVNKNAINYGDSVTLTIRTSSAANNVWVEYDNSYGNASRQTTYSNGDKSWSVTVYPTYTQNLHIMANTSKTDSGAACELQRITVENPGQNMGINSFSANKTTVSPGENVTFTLNTGTLVSNAWIDTGYSYMDMTLATSSSSYKIWTYTMPVSSTTQFRAYANTSKSTSGAATQTLLITVQPPAEEPVIVGTPEVTGFLPPDGSKANIKFSVYTNKSVTRVNVIAGDGSTGVATVSDGTDGIRVHWTVTVNMSNGGYAVQVPCDIYAWDINGNNAYAGVDVPVQGGALTSKVMN